MSLMQGTEAYQALVTRHRPFAGQYLSLSCTLPLVQKAFPFPRILQFPVGAQQVLSSEYPTKNVPWPQVHVEPVFAHTSPHKYWLTPTHPFFSRWY